MTQAEVKQLMQRLGERADERGVASLSGPERSALLAWWARGVIGNGGFKYFCEGSGDLTDVAAAFRALGLERAAAACEQVATAVFPPAGRAPGDDAQRRSALRGVAWKSFDPQEDAIYDVKWDDLGRAISEYVDHHRAEFGA